MLYNKLISESQCYLYPKFNQATTNKILLEQLIEQVKTDTIHEIFKKR